MAPNAITSALFAVAGLLLAFGVHAGLDVLVVPALAALAGGVVSAWLLLTKIPPAPLETGDHDRTRYRNSLVFGVSREAASTSDESGATRFVTPLSRSRVRTRSDERVPRSSNPSKPQLEREIASLSGLESRR